MGPLLPFRIQGPIRRFANVSTIMTLALDVCVNKNYNKLLLVFFSFKGSNPPLNLFIRAALDGIRL